MFVVLIVDLDGVTIKRGFRKRNIAEKYRDKLESEYKIDNKIKDNDPLWASIETHRIPANKENS